MGLGGGHYNYLVYGDFPKDREGKELVFPSGVITGLDPSSIKVAPVDQKQIAEH